MPDVILTVRYMSARASGGARGVARFMRYVQYRDQHEDSGAAQDADGLIRYVHHRDRTAHKTRLFDANGDAGDGERRALVDHIGRSVKDAGGPGRSTTSDRAVYRFIISPADARGLDLRQMTRAAMGQLAAEAGTGGMPPWIAGEHRNTAHPHVHVVLAARRETAPGEFRTLVITRDRLGRMKTALGRDLTRQRQVGQRLQASALRAGEVARRSQLQTIPSPERTMSHAPAATPTLVGDGIGARTKDPGLPVMGSMWLGATMRIAASARRLARLNQRETERLAMERTRGREDHEPRRGRHL